MFSSYIYLTSDESNEAFCKFNFSKWRNISMQRYLEVKLKIVQYWVNELYCKGKTKLDEQYLHKSQQKYLKDEVKEHFIWNQVK